MRGSKRNPRLIGLGVLLAIPVLCGGQATAEVHTDQGGSLIIFPKVISDGDRDTIIKITNKSNMQATAHCFYTNALGFCSTSTGNSCFVDGDCPTGETCDAPCAVDNFDIALTAQQPTFWRVSVGRFADLTADPCDFGSSCACDVDAQSGSINCPGFPPSAVAGQNNNAVRGVGEAFVGDLRCYQTDPSDGETPTGQNALIGEAIITTLDDGEQSQYNAITVSSPTDGPDSDLDLNLDNTEYNACPDSLVFTHYGIGGEEIATGATVSTEISLATCSAMYSVGEVTSATVHYRVTDQFESTLSADGRSFDCHLTRPLDEIETIFETTSAASNLLKTRVLVDATRICLTGDNAGQECSNDNQCPNAVSSPETGLLLGCRASSGVVGVAEEFYSASPRPDGSSAYSLTNEGDRASDGGDVISVPASNP